MANPEQTRQMTSGAGFVAALDQSGGSTPKALKLYGLDETTYSNDAEMFDLIHEMRARIARAPGFTGDRVIGAILFEMTMEREIDGLPSAKYLWEKRGIVPFLKVDKGLAGEESGVQLMKPIDSLDEALERAVKAGIFGTKMRSVINAANPTGIRANVEQQFEIGTAILAYGLTPIIEPEINISIDDKADAEKILLSELTRSLDALPEDCQVMLKLTLPENPDTYATLVNHPRVMRVVALSGGYSREEANRRLAQNHGVIASFSRALTEGLSAGQTDDGFNQTLESSVAGIHAASVAE